MARKTLEQSVREARDIVELTCALVRAAKKANVSLPSLMRTVRSIWKSKVPT